MDTLAVTRAFRQLLSHRTCSRIRFYPTARNVTASARRGYQKKSAEDVSSENGRRDSTWQQRSDFLPPDRSEEFMTYPLVDADGLRARKRPPRCVKMLMRDFIEGGSCAPFSFPGPLMKLLDSLYNPHYGYFPKHAVIFTPGEPFDFGDLRSETEFQNLLGQRYTEFEDRLDEEAPDDTRQLWHTPTELFRPYYGEAIARYMVTNYKLLHHPYHDLIIYEMGAGNGTLMLNVLDYIQDVHPDVYERTKFNIIEISSALAALQTAQLARTASSRGHQDHVEIINRSIFNWDSRVTAPCYFLSLEVFDNFAHDAIRYEPITEQPLQGLVLIDDVGDFYEFYTREIDPVADRFLRLRHAACTRPFDHPIRSSRFLRALKARLPFAANLTVPEFIPTRLMQFFDILRDYFPLHQLLASDFNSLPGAIKGVNAPVVQTRYQRRTVPVRTPLVSRTVTCSRSQHCSITPNSTLVSSSY